MVLTVANKHEQCYFGENFNQFLVDVKQSNSTDELKSVVFILTDVRRVPKKRIGSMIFLNM